MEKTRGKEKKEANEPEKKEIKISQKDYEKRILELCKGGLTAEKIGEALRKEGVHPKSYGKKISKILIENNLYENPDLKNVGEKLKKIKAHREKNKKDKRAMREIVRISAQFGKLKKYLKIPS